MATSGVAVGDVVQLRLLLETWAVREAAEKPDATVDGDFHAGLVGLAGNVLVTAVMTSVRGAVRSYVGAGATRLPDWTATSQRLRASPSCRTAGCERRLADSRNARTDHSTE